MRLDVGIVGGALEGLAQRTLTLRESALAQQPQTISGIWQGIVGGLLDGTLEEPFGLVVLVGIVQEDGEGDQRRKAFRRALQRLAAQGQGLVTAALVPEEGDQPRARLGIVGIQRQSTAQATLGAGGMPQLRLNDAVEARHLSVVRRDRQSALEQGFGVGPAAAGDLDLGEVDEGGQVGGVAAQHPLKEGHGLRRIAGAGFAEEGNCLVVGVQLVQQATELQQHAGVVGA